MQYRVRPFLGNFSLHTCSLNRLVAISPWQSAVIKLPHFPKTCFAASLCFAVFPSTTGICFRKKATTIILTRSMSALLAIRSVFSSKAMLSTPMLSSTPLFIVWYASRPNSSFQCKEAQGSSESPFDDVWPLAVDKLSSESPSVPEVSSSVSDSDSSAPVPPTRN